MLFPSNELMSAVLECKVEVYQQLQSLGAKGKDNYFRAINRDLLKNSGYGEEIQINIHEFAHMCKEWAWKQSYVSNSILFFDFESNKIYSCSVGIANKLNWKNFEADSEVESIIKACEFILTEKAENDISK